MKWARILISTAAVSMILCSGYHANTISYFDHAPYWGVPIKIQEDTYIAEEHAVVVAGVQTLPMKIAKLQESAKSLVQQEKYLYNELFNWIVRLEQESRMLPEAIAKIGPMANMDLKDLTGTDKALDAVNQYQAELPMDSVLRTMTSGLLMNLNQPKIFKSHFLEHMYQHQTENPIVVEYTAPVYVYVAPEADADGYVDPNAQPQIVEVSPAYQNRSWNISEEDGKILGMAHKIHTDIDLVQIKLVKTTIEIVTNMRLLDNYQQQLATNNENPTVRVSVAKAPVTFMFMQAKSKAYVWAGQPIFRCRLGTMWCRQVGHVKEVFDKPHKANAFSRKPVDGFLVEIELQDQSDMKAKVFHIDKDSIL